MTQTKAGCRFYPLQNQEWLSMTQKLRPTELVVLYHLRTLDPFGDRLRINVAELAKELNINKRTCSRALQRLSNEGYITLQLETVVVSVVRDQDQKVTPIDRYREQPDQEAIPIEQPIEQPDQKTPPPPPPKPIPKVKERLTEGVDQKIPMVDRPVPMAPLNCPKPGDQKVPEVDQKVQGVDQKIPKVDQKVQGTPPESAQGDDRDRSNTIKTIKTDQIEDADRDLRDFMRRTIEKDKGIELKNPRAYIDRCLENDRAHWEALYQESKSPQRRTRDTIAEDIYLLELSVKGAMDGKDYEFARGRLNQCKAKAEILLTQYPEWRELLC